MESQEGKETKTDIASRSGLAFGRTRSEMPLESNYLVPGNRVSDASKGLRLIRTAMIFFCFHIGTIV